MYDWLVQRRLAQDDLFMAVNAIAQATDVREAVRLAVERSDLVLVLIGQHWLSVADAGVAAWTTTPRAQDRRSISGPTSIGLP